MDTAPATTTSIWSSATPQGQEIVSTPRPPTVDRWVGQPEGLDVQRLRRGDDERRPLREKGFRRRRCRRSNLTGPPHGHALDLGAA